MKKMNILTSMLCAAALLGNMCTAAVLPASAAEASAAADTVTFTFTDAGITPSGGTSGYKIDGTSLTISESGSYKVTGSCESGSVKVKKGIKGVTLTLSDLTLKNTTAPLMCNKDSQADIIIEGTVSLEDSAENSEDYWTDKTYSEFGTDTDTYASDLDAAENAVVKFKGASKVTVSGEGTLNIKANAKNGIKSGSTLDSDLETELAPDESSEYYAYLTIDGPTINIDTSSVYIPSTTTATNNNTFPTSGAPGGGGGFNPGGPGGGGGFNPGGPGGMDEKPSDAVGDGINAECRLDIVSGDITIKAGDDGIHCDYEMNLGKYGASNDGLKIDIQQSYEGIEAATLNFLSGDIDITASDDAVNAANGDLNNYGFTLSVYGGDIYADASNGNDNDALDSNGSIDIYGGRVIAITASSGNAFDSEGGFNLYSGTVLGIGNTMQAPSPTNKNTTASDWGVAQWGSAGGMGGFGGFGGGSTGADTSALTLQVGSSQSGLSVGTTPSISANSKVAVTYSDTTELISTTAKSSANYVIYADKTIPDNIRTLTLDPNNGKDAEEINVSSGDVVSLTLGDIDPDETKFVSEGDYLIEWNTEKDGSGISVESGSDFYVYSDTKLYAIWHEDVDYSVTYVSNDNTDNAKKDTVRSGDKYTIIDDPFEDNGMTFTGWNTKVDGTGTAYAPGDVITAEGDVTLYAQWSYGYTVKFNYDEGVENVTVYTTQKFAGETITDSAYAYNSETGEIDMSGDGQINFTVNLKDGCAVDAVAATEGAYKNIKDSADTGKANTYRITKITGDLEVTITTKEAEKTDSDVQTDSDTEADSEGEEAQPFIVTFEFDPAKVSVTTYDTQKYEDGGNENRTAAFARNADTGDIVNDGSGQVNFTLIPADGYEVDSVTASPETNFKNLKGAADTGLADTYRVTKITGDVTVIVTMKEAAADSETESDTAPDITPGTDSDSGTDASDTDTSSDIEPATDTEGEIPTDTPDDPQYDPEPAKSFTGTFVINGGEASITTYKTQDYTKGEENQTSATARSSETGEELSDGNGQINFTVIPAEGYEVESVTATEGAYKNIKGPADTGVANTFRVTKITGDLTITVTLKKTEQSGGDDKVTVLMGDTTQDGVIFSDDALFTLRHSLMLDTLTGIPKAVADVDEDKTIDSADALLILRYSIDFVDANSCAGEEREISTLELD